MAKEVRGRALTTLAHHIDVPFLQEAYRRTRKEGAVGVDGQTAEAYAEPLDENLTTLLDRGPPVARAGGLMTSSACKGTSTTDGRIL